MPDRPTADDLRRQAQCGRSGCSCARSGGSWHCPNGSVHEHNDNTPSLGIDVGSDGKILVTCRSAKCSFADIVTAFGYEQYDFFPDDSPRPKAVSPKQPKPPVTSPEPNEHPNTSVTLTSYVEHMGIPAAEQETIIGMLRDLGCEETTYKRKPAIQFHYYDDAGTELEEVERYRVGLTKDGPRFGAKKGSKTQLYGQEDLPQAREAGFIWLVEGESDRHVIAIHGHFAIGIPGATNWNEDRDSKLLAGIDRVYAVIEPDAAGESLLKTLQESAIRDQVYVVTPDLLDDCGDVLDLYRKDPDAFLGKIEHAEDAAKPLRVFTETRMTPEMQELYDEAKGLIEDPHLLDRVDEFIQHTGYAGDTKNPLIAFLGMTSVHTEKPINLSFIGQSSSGKNAAIEAAMMLMPTEMIYGRDGVTEHTLIYTDEEFVHRVMYIEEADSFPDEGPAASAIRALAEKNRLTYETTERVGGTFGTRLIEKLGPTMLITTTTEPLDRQLATRMGEVHVTDSPKHSRKIARSQGDDAARTIAEKKAMPNAGPFIALQSAAPTSWTVPRSSRPTASYMARGNSAGERR